MDGLIVDERIARRHRELTDEDVMAAMRQMMAYKQRTTGEWLAVGTDAHGRLLELVYLFYPEERVLRLSRDDAAEPEDSEETADREELSSRGECTGAVPS